MNPLRVSARGYRTFAQLDHEFQPGCTVICGPNGAGKSSLVNLIDICLFAGRGELAPLVTVGETQLELTLEFEHAGELYRVRRTYSRGKTTLDLERVEDSGDRDDGYALTWIPLTRETVDATQAELERILGLTRTTFRASAFLAQGDGAAWTEATPAARRSVVAEILGLDTYDRLQQHARTDIRAVETELAGIAPRIEERTAQAARHATIAGLVATTETIETEAARDLAAAERELEQAQAALAAVAAARERVRACTAERDHAKAERDRAADGFAKTSRALELLPAEQERLTVADQAAGEVLELEQELTEALAEAEARVEVERLEREIAQAVADADQAAAAERDLRGRIQHMRSHDDATCDRCGQPLGTARDVAIASLNAEIAVHHEQRAAAAGRETKASDQVAVARDRLDALAGARPVADIQAALQTARRAAETRAAIATLVAGYQELAAQHDDARISLDEATATLAAKQADLEDAAAAVGDTAQLETAVATHRNRVAEERARLDQARAELARLRHDLDLIAAAKTELDELTSQQTTLHGRLDLLKLADRAFGRDGIPALIVEAIAVPQIEAEANRILAELATSYVVELRTQRALKTDAEKVRETLDIIIHADGGERPYETFSGGERTRLNLALRIALARLLANRRGAESRVLVIDEPEYLDDHGVARLADVLQGLAGDFEKVTLISHMPQLAAAFDRAVTVVKDGGVSRVETDVAVGVAA